MTGHQGRWLRSERLRATLSYPYRLGPPGPAWSGTPFAGLATVNNLSGAGDALVTVALAGSVFVSVSLHAARGRTALGLLCTVLPFAVVGPLIGPLIDRAPGGRRFIVFGAAIGRMGACLLMGAWLHGLLLFPAAFLFLVCSRTHAVAKASLVPGVVDSEADLVRANSRLAVGGAVYTTAGAAVGSLIYWLLGSHAVLDVDVVLFATLAGLSLHLLRDTREPATRPAAAGSATAGSASSGSASPGLTGPGSATPGADADERAAGAGAGERTAGAGIAVTRGGRLRRVMRGRDVPWALALAQVAMAGMRFAAGFLTALIVFAFRRQGAPLVWYGLVAVASVGGNFTGALLAPRLRRHVTEKRLVGGAALAVAATAIGVAWWATESRRPAALVLAFVVALGASAAKAAFDAVVQSETPDSERSRLFARFESVFQLAWVLGALIPTLIATSLLVGFVLTAAVVLATSGVFVVGLAVRRREPAGSTPRIPGRRRGDTWGAPLPPPG